MRQKQKKKKKTEEEGEEETLASKPQDFAEHPLDTFALEQEIARSDRPP